MHAVVPLMTLGRILRLSWRDEAVRSRMATAFTTPLVAGHIPELPDGLVFDRPIKGPSKASEEFGNHN